MVTIPVSYGELVDKITILRIKRARFTDAGSLKHVRRELALLEEILTGTECEGLEEVIIELATTNEQLWEVEDHLRDKEADKDFGESFITLARSVYRLNGQRSNLKRKIDVLMGSGIVEEKKYGRQPV